MKISFLAFLLFGSLLTNAQNVPLYVGSYTNGASEGIYYYDFNTKTGELNNKKLAAEAINPSFLTFSSNKNFLYAVSEVANFNKEKSGFVNAYRVAENGTLQLINKVSTNGADPCHVQLNCLNTKAAISNYTGGTVSIHKVLKNGTIQEAHQVLNHNTTTQQSHTHSAKFYKNNLFVADLGRNFLAQYTEDPKNTSDYLLKTNYQIENNAGPRHFEISKKGKYIYVISELNSTITVLKKENNNYTSIQNISTLDTTFKGESFCADIHLSKNEQFLYGSNRGENSIAVFKRDTKNGTIQKIQTISAHGDWPRNFTLAPNGKFLLVANQKSDNISVYSVNKTTGRLTFLHDINTPSPVCLLF